VVVREFGEDELLDVSCLIVFSESNVFDVNVKHFEEVETCVGRVYRMTPNNRSSAVSVDRAHLEGNIGEVEVLLWVDFDSLDLDCAVVWIFDRLGVLLLYDNDEVVGLALVPDTVRGEDHGSTVVVISQEGWVLLGWHVVDEHVWLVVTFLILKWWQNVREIISNIESPTGVDLCLKVRISVFEHIDVQVQLCELVKLGASSENGSSDSLSLLRVCLNEDSSLSLILVPSS
jgi:hypothetical protein